MKNLVFGFVKKYTITFVCIVLFAAVMVFDIEKLGNVYTANFNNNLLVEISMLVGGLIESTFLFTILFDVYKYKLPNVIRDNAIVRRLSVLLISIGLYLIIRAISAIYVGFGTGYLTYYTSTIFLSLIYFCIVSDKEMDMADYMQKVFINMLILLIVMLVVMAGTGILFYIVTVLFKYNDFTKLMDLMIIESVVIGYVGMFIAIENVDRESGAFEKILIKYVMCIMVLMGFAFFYIYLVRIIINRELPSNEVFGVCTLLFAIGLFIALMARSFDEDKVYDKIIKFLPVAFIPALILQGLSLFLRIGQYGLTTIRYLGFVFLLVELAYVILYILNYKKLKYIFIIIAVLAFIASYIPFINAYQFPAFYNSHFIP